MRASSRRAFIRGVAVSAGWADATRSLPELIFAGVSAALSDAQVEMDQVDSVVLSAHDLVDGLSLSSMVTAPAAGAYLRDEIRLAEDGLCAASLAAARVEAGESALTVVAAWGRASEGDFDGTSRAAFDPFLVQPFGLRELEVSALRLSAWLARFPGREAARADAAAARAARAARNPRAAAAGSPQPALGHPLRAGEGPRWADIVVAAVVGPAEAAVRIAGVGHSTDLPAIGDRDLLGLPSLREAADRALADAGIAAAAIDLHEIDGITLADEALALEALGLAAAGEGFAAYGAAPAINPAGGGAAGWCYPAMGLVRLAECHLQLTGRAGAVQVPGRPRRALAVGASPVGAQTHTAIVLEAA